MTLYPAVQDTVGRSPHDRSPKVLVIGFGRSPLPPSASHPPEGAPLPLSLGAQVAQAVNQRHYPQVTTRSVVQLTPELSTALAAADQVIFTNACWMRNSGPIRVNPLHPLGSETTGCSVPGIGHSLDPASLMALTRSVYGRCPQGWWVELAAPWEGDRHSPKHSVAAAVSYIAGVIEQTMAIPS